MSILAAFRFRLSNFGTVVRNNIVLVVSDDLGYLSISLYHFLMVTPALYRTPWLNLSGHQTKDPTKSSCLFWFKSMSIVFNKGNVFNSLGEIPHALFLIAFFIMALPNILKFLSLYEEKWPAGPSLRDAKDGSLTFHVLSQLRIFIISIHYLHST